MAQREDIHRELDFLTDLLSGRVRWLAGAVLALSWGFAVASPQVSGSSFSVPPGRLLMPMILALAAILSDLLQYIFGYLNNLRMLRAVEANPDGRVGFDRNDPLWRMRSHLFHAKIALAIAAGGWLVLVLGLQLLAWGRPS